MAPKTGTILGPRAHSNFQDALESQLTYEPNTGCWLYMGRLTGHGYGSVYCYYEHRRAHRVAYEAYVGPIPDGLEIDHLCNMRSCCNPSHLKAATRGANALGRRRNQTHCKNGHEFTAETTYVDKKRGWRGCNICRGVAAKKALQNKRLGISPGSNRQKTHCKRGHEFTKKNTRTDKIGRRYCRACSSIRDKIDRSRF